MKYNSLLNIPTSLLLFVLMACNENSFTTIVDIDVAEHNPLLTLSSRIIVSHNNIDYPFNNIVVIGKSSGINSVTNNNGIEEVKVQLFENDLLVDIGDEIKTSISDWDLGIDSTVAYRLSFDDYKEGNEYKITAEKEGFETIIAKQKFQTADSIQSIEYIIDGKLNADGFVTDEINIFIDQVEDQKYYLIDAEYLYKNTTADSIIFPFWIDPVYLDSTDPLLRSVEEGGLIIKGSDIINDNELKLHTYGDNNFPDGTLFRLNLHVITHDQFLFLLSKYQYEQSNGNPFAEPTEVYSNVENGFGIFSIETINSKVIEIH